MLEKLRLVAVRGALISFELALLTLESRVATGVQLVLTADQLRV